jgi:hypothetical protein
MKFKVTYTIDGFLKVFVDVVECCDIEECEVSIRRLVTECVGARQFKIVLIVASN